ncbi:MAG: histidine phosphatase family protein [Desulfobacterales bacterium]|nr:MAG: histidine phosphatase family protein [Desulfobacterales bacterium]
MSVIYLVRHGQASFGSDNYDRLSATGVRQARIVARRFENLGLAFDAVYCGTLERQVQTAQELIDRYEERGRPVPRLALAEAFDEYDSQAVWKAQIPLMLAQEPALAEDLARVRTDRKAFQRLFEGVMRRWVSGSYDPPGVCRWQDFTRRVRQGLETVMEKHGARKQVVIFTSGGPISVAIQQTLGLSDAKTIEISWQVMNASITRFKYNAGRMALAGFNDVNHLELEQDQALLTYR